MAKIYSKLEIQSAWYFALLGTSWFNLGEECGWCRNALHEIRVYQITKNVLLLYEKLLMKNMDVDTAFSNEKVMDMDSITCCNMELSIIFMFLSGYHISIYTALYYIHYYFQ